MARDNCMETVTSFELEECIAGHGSSGLWADLPWKDCYLSLKTSGDLGPSGSDPEAVRRRQQALESSVTLADVRGETVIVAKQTHTLRVIALVADGRFEIWEGAWKGDGEDRLEITRTAVEAWDTTDLPGLADTVGRMEADGLLTDDKRLDLGVTVADCMSLFVRDRVGKGVRALLHSGWQGTGILSVAAEASRSLFGICNTDLELLSGPSIAACDYPVSEERSVLFESRFGPSSVNRDGMQPCLDLVAANAALFGGRAPCYVLSGSSAGRYCACRTSTPRSPLCHSFRRDGKESYGRMLALWRGSAI